MKQHSSERPVVLSETEAREGTTGHNVRYVLGVSTAAVAVLFLVIWLSYFA